MRNPVEKDVGGKHNGKDVTGKLTTGEAFLNGKPLGPCYENSDRKIPPGPYDAHVRSESDKGNCVDADGFMGHSGFMIELKNVKNRVAILIHAGNSPWHSDGCIMLGPTEKKKDDKTKEDRRKAPQALIELREQYLNLKTKLGREPVIQVVVEVKTN